MIISLCNLIYKFFINIFYFFIMFNLAIMPFVVFISIFIFNYYLKEIEVRILQTIPNPAGNVAVSLVGEGNFLDHIDDVEPMTFSLYAHRVEEIPDEPYSPILRQMGFEPAALISRGKYWSIAEEGSAGIAHWDAPYHFVFRFCKGSIRHFKNSASLDIGMGNKVVISADISYEDCPGLKK